MKNRNYRSSVQGRAVGIADAEKILHKAEVHFGLDRGEMGKLPRGDPRRAAIAWAVHRRCCVQLAWLAEQLNLSSAANASQQIRRFRKITSRTLPMELRSWRRDLS